MRDLAHDRWLRAVMHDRGLSPAARALATVLIADFLGTARAPDTDAFAKAICTSQRTARRALDQLADAGWLIMPDRPKRGDPTCIILTERCAVLPFPGATQTQQGPAT